MVDDDDLYVLFSSNVARFSKSLIVISSGFTEVFLLIIRFFGEIDN